MLHLPTHHFSFGKRNKKRKEVQGGFGRIKIGQVLKLVVAFFDKPPFKSISSSWTFIPWLRLPIAIKHQHPSRIRLPGQGEEFVVEAMSGGLNLCNHNSNKINSQKKDNFSYKQNFLLQNLVLLPKIKQR